MNQAIDRLEVIVLPVKYRLNELSRLVSCTAGVR